MPSGNIAYAAFGTTGGGSPVTLVSSDAGPVAMTQVIVIAPDNSGVAPGAVTNVPVSFNYGDSDTQIRAKAKVAVQAACAAAGITVSRVQVVR